MFELSNARIGKLPGWTTPTREHRKRIRGFLEQYLGRKGWARAMAEGSAVDLDGPIPWYTYPAIRELTRVIPEGARVFEYGSGNSTLWWSARASELVSVEHDRPWYEHSKAAERSDVRLREPGDQTHADRFDELRGMLGELSPAPAGLDEQTLVSRGIATEPFLSYVAELLTFPAAHFDVIIVDGMAREACARIAAQRLKPGGMIVFDNSDRDAYAGAYAHLIEKGFARMDYWGPGPINAYEWCTSIFTRSLDLFQR